MNKCFMIYISTKKKVCGHCLTKYPRSTPLISISIKEDTVDICVKCMMEWTEKIITQIEMPE